MITEKKSLELIMYERQTDKYDHQYWRAYEQHFSAYRDAPIDLLEIGVYKAASLFMWADFLEKADITGIDINPMFEVNVDRIHTIVCDVNEYVPEKKFDIIIDDGSHHNDDIIVAYHRLWPYVKPGGWYCIEDLATQYLVESHGYGGTTHGSRASEMITSIMDRILNGELRFEITEFHAHDELVFLRKAK